MSFPYSHVMTMRRALPSLLLCMAALFSSLIFSPSAMAAPTCAQGGLCVLGDTGPGGGKVFFVKATGSFTKSRTVSDFMSSQTFTVSLTSAQQAALTFDYLEVAPTQSSSMRWGSNGAITGGTGSLIGTGASNTANIVSTFPSDTTSNNVAHFADNYTNNSKSDWFLPSYDELLLIMILSLESDSGGPNIGSFPDGLWASTSSDNSNARYSARNQLSGYVVKASSAKSVAVRSFSQAAQSSDSNIDSDAAKRQREAMRVAAVKAAREKINAALVANTPITVKDISDAEAPLKSVDSLLAAYQELIAFRRSITTSLTPEGVAQKKFNTIMKYAMYERITGTNTGEVFGRNLVAFGVMSPVTPYKQLTTYQLMKTPLSERDSITKIDAFFVSKAKKFTDRNAHLAAIIAKIHNR